MYTILQGVLWRTVKFPKANGLPEPVSCSVDLVSVSVLICDHFLVLFEIYCFVGFIIIMTPRMVVNKIRSAYIVC